jgi:hypothetical protein
MKPIHKRCRVLACAVLLGVALLAMALTTPRAASAQTAYDLVAKVVAFPHKVQSGDQIRFRVTARNRGPGTSNPFKIIVVPGNGVRVDMVLAKPGVVTVDDTGRIEVHYSKGLDANELVDVNLPSTATGAAVDGRPAEQRREPGEQYGSVHDDHPPAELARSRRSRNGVARPGHDG